MAIIELGNDEYRRLINHQGPIFCGAEFSKLNENKVDKVHYLQYKNRKPRLAFVIGEVNGQWKAPFSSPFSIPIELRKDTNLEYYWDFFKELIDYVKTQNGKSIDIYLPPNIYGEMQNAKISNALLGNGFKIEYQEVNYSFDLLTIDEGNYIDAIHYNAKKNLNIARQSGLSIIKCDTFDLKQEAYEIIRVNRESKDYYLAMTKEQVMSTTEIVECDFFIVKHYDDSIASAIVFHVTEDIVQVIYWGDVPGVSDLKPINYLAFELVRYYKKNGLKAIDIGPSSPNGIPNFGLCSFKESIGCIVSAKNRFQIIFRER